MVIDILDECPLCRESQLESRATMDLPDLARIMGISRGKIYDLASRDELPVKVIKLGRRLVLSRAEVHRLLHRGKDSVAQDRLGS